MQDNILIDNHEISRMQGWPMIQAKKQDKPIIEWRLLTALKFGLISF